MLRRVAAIAMVLGAASAALGQRPSWQPRPHPAVARIIAPEQGAASFGSGTLIAVNATHGLVVTNWHVVRDATGQVSVAFPDGFHSAATVLKVDKDWDLAVLCIRRPNIRPVPLAEGIPRRGEVLTIAGYGSGSYQSSAGRCTGYVAPAKFGRTMPAEMVEVSTPARNGDSGGPIFNSRGELAGVLFGSASGETTGTYSGRVRWFLASVYDRFYDQPNRPPSRMIAARARPAPSNRVTTPYVPPTASIVAAPHERPSLDLPDRAVRPLDLTANPGTQPSGLPPQDVVAATPAEPSLPTRADQIKTFLAFIGGLAILFHGLRVFSFALKT